MKSFLKWTCGKGQLVDVLVPTIVDLLGDGRRYYEPFVGSGAVALALPASVRVSVSDACAELVNAWDVVRRTPKALSAAIERHREKWSEARFYRARENFGQGDDVARAARFIFLNKAAFNGLYRVNASGGFNVPYGRGKPTSLPTLEELQELSNVIGTWSIQRCDFEETVDRAGEGDVVFADPPYHETHDYSSGFDETDRRRLAESLRSAHRRGAGVVVTDADAPRTRSLYKWMRIVSIDERRRIAARADRREAAACLMGVA